MSGVTMIRREKREKTPVPADIAGAVRHSFKHYSQRRGTRYFWYDVKPVMIDGRKRYRAGAEVETAEWDVKAEAWKRNPLKTLAFAKRWKAKDRAYKEGD
jgi:hypothetical protein